MEVKGIGEKRFLNLQDLIVVRSAEEEKGDGLLYKDAEPEPDDPVPPPGPPPAPLVSVSTYTRQPRVSLSFNPASILYGSSSTLASASTDGHAPYVAYEYQYDNHYIWDPGWRDSALTGAVTTLAWDHYIKYRVRVQDANGAWSDWSNEAYLWVTNVPDPLPGAPMSTSGQL